MNTDTVELSSLDVNNISEIVSAFKSIGWNKPQTLFELYLQDQNQDRRFVRIAKVKDVFAGYVTLKWTSDHPFLDNAPEIVDLNVLPKFRRKGIGTLLIKSCENAVKEKGFNIIGLGVGMTEDYGSAQHLYIQLGYMPDRRGIHYKNKQLKYGDLVIIDDDLVLYFEKTI